VKWLLAAIAVIAVGLLATRDLWLGERVTPDEAVTAAPVASAGPCPPAPSFEAAAKRNAESLHVLDWKPFGVAERGWRIYAPLIAREIGTPCPAEAPGFAAALAAWQTAKDQPATGEMSAEVFEAMRVAWMVRRPFVLATRDGTCIAGADPSELEPLAAEEAYGGKAILLDPRALKALRALREAAKSEVPAVAEDDRLLRVISGYRSPAENEARCANGACGGPGLAKCSPHRTGLALDFYLGSASGFDVASTAQENRVWQAQTPTYRWLAQNARRFGFIPYPYEPWHWEWAQHD
jgi:hypothetical protein